MAPNLATRRKVLVGTATVVLAATASYLYRRERRIPAPMRELPIGEPEIVNRRMSMPYRPFGRTGLQVSEVGFGAWGIGGKSYGPVERQQALSALARAEELGCNFVDTAQGYGNSEEVLGDFLQGRRNRWIVATKFSGQSQGLTKTLESQLRTLRIDAVDYYQLHWVPRRAGGEIYEELDRVKRAGKARFVGVSLYSSNDIDFVIDHTNMDGVMIQFSLLDPDPFLARIERLRNSNLAVIARSVLKEGFLVGNLGPNASFPDPTDQRHKWSKKRIAKTAELASRFRFLEKEGRAMVEAAAQYPLSYPEVSTVLMGTTSVPHADSNFGRIPGGRLSRDEIRKIQMLQEELDLRQPVGPLGRLVWLAKQRLLPD